MRQKRIHKHDDSHYDFEEFIGGIWAVTKCNCKLITQEADMALTINGNRTGAAAHGVDELEVAPTVHYDRLTNATDRVQELFGDDKYFVNWLMRIPEGKVLEYCENIIAQITRYNEGTDEVDAANWQDEADTIARARSIALDANGNLRSYANFPRLRGKPLSADEVDLYIEADDHWYHDNPNY